MAGSFYRLRIMAALTYGAKNTEFPWVSAACLMRINQCTD